MQVLNEVNRSLSMPRRGLFITGTDTDVGKTYVAAEIARRCREAGCRTGVYKPVASGCDSLESTFSDGWRLWDAAGRPGRLTDVCPQAFRAPLAPHLAARAENREVDEQLLLGGLQAWAEYDLVIVEGVGGLMSPVSDTTYVADLAARLQWPLIVVARNRIGVINQTLQTLIVADNRGVDLAVAGIVLNDCDNKDQDDSCESNPQELASRCGPPLLAHIRHGDPRPLGLIDWVALAAAKHP